MRFSAKRPVTSGRRKGPHWLSLSPVTGTPGRLLVVLEGLCFLKESGLSHFLLRLIPTPLPTHCHRHAEAQLVTVITRPTWSTNHIAFRSLAHGAVPRAGPAGGRRRRGRACGPLAFASPVLVLGEVRRPCPELAVRGRGRTEWAPFPRLWEEAAVRERRTRLEKQ